MFNFNNLLSNTEINIDVNNNYVKKITFAVNDNLGKIKKAAKVQRPKMIMKIINEAVTGLSWSEKNVNGITVYNVSHPADIITKVRKNGKAVYQFDKSGNLVNTYPSVQAAHRATGISDASICYCANNKYGFKTAGGYKWSYREAV